MVTAAFPSGKTSGLEMQMRARPEAASWLNVAVGVEPRPALLPWARQAGGDSMWGALNSSCCCRSAGFSGQLLSVFV